MSIKVEFLESFRTSLPAGISDFLTIPIGDIPEVTFPTDIENAIIANGQVMANINNHLLRPFSGLTPVEAFMRNGQLNAGLLALVLSALEVIGASADSNITVIAPKDGETYEAQSLKCEASTDDAAVTAMTVTIGNETIDLQDDGGGVFSGWATLSPGDNQTALFVADSGARKSVTFHVNDVLMTTYPAEGDTVGTVFQARTSFENLNPPGTGVESVTLTIGQQVFELAKQDINNFTATVELAAAEAAQKATFAALVAGKQILKVINFLVQ